MRKINDFVQELFNFAYEILKDDGVFFLFLLNDKEECFKETETFYDAFELAYYKKWLDINCLSVWCARVSNITTNRLMILLPMWVTKIQSFMDPCNRVKMESRFNIREVPELPMQSCEQWIDSDKPWVVSNKQNKKPTTSKEIKKIIYVSNFLTCSYHLQLHSDGFQHLQCETVVQSKNVAKKCVAL